MKIGENSPFGFDQKRFEFQSFLQCFNEPLSGLEFSAVD